MSKKVWAIDIDTMNITMAIGLNISNKNADREINIEPTKLICIPGVKPVRVPKIIPKNKANIISSNILAVLFKKILLIYFCIMLSP